MKDVCCTCNGDWVYWNKIGWVILSSGQWCRKISTDSSREEEQEGPCWSLILIFAYFLDTKETAFWPNSTTKITTSAQCNVLFLVEEFQRFTLFFPPAISWMSVTPPNAYPRNFSTLFSLFFFICLFFFSCIFVPSLDYVNPILTYRG